jgi:oxygen-dependent protoporphyrinogen oxidase
MTGQARIVVVGGGMSGLTTAWWLQRAGSEVTVLESGAAAGGTMRTVHDDGWLVEQGPNSALETTPLFGEMFDALGILGERAYADPASDRRYILRDGTLHPLPMSAGAFLRSRLWTPAGKARLLKEPFVGKGTREESVAEFVERRLGREFLDFAINPFVAGVYAGSPEHLSVRAAFPKLYALEEKYGGLIKGMVLGARERKRRAEKAKDRARMFSFAGGMETFPATIAKHLGRRIRTGVRVIRCTVQEGTGEGRTYRLDFEEAGRTLTLDADVVVFSVPAFVAAGLVRGIDRVLADRLAEVQYPPVAEVFLGYPEDRLGRPLDGFGYLIPAVEKRRILGTIWSSALFPGRAPSGHAALTTFVGGSRNPELLGRSDADLVAMTREELGEIMGVRGEPAFSRVMRWDRAIPQYTLGYGALLETLDRCELQQPGLFFCSNYRGGIAVGDCVMSGHRTAGRVEDFVKHADRFQSKGDS